MPNPTISCDPIHSYLSLPGSRWRIHLEFIKGRGYTAQLQYHCGDGWRGTGLRYRDSSHSTAVGGLIRRYRRAGDFMERVWSFNGQRGVDAPCPRCHYAHAHIHQTNDVARWYCPACKHGDTRILTGIIIE